MADRATEAARARQLQQIATDLLRDVDAVADEVAARVVASEPRLDGGEAVVRSTRDNVGAILAMLAYGVPGDAILPSLGALELLERMSGDDDGLVVVVRGYGLGLRAVWPVWAAHVRARVDDPDDLVAILATSTEHMFTYVDRMSRGLAAEWEAVRRRRAAGSLGEDPHAVVHQVLAGGRPTADLRAVGHDPDGPHVAFAVGPDADAGALRGVAGPGAAILDGGGDDRVVWVAGSSADPAAVAAALDPGGPVGIGGSHAGPAGFRATRDEAVDARRVALLRGSGGAVRYADVALLAVLCADTARARTLVRAELGPLVAADESSARLRETLAAYLACGESHVGAAERLHVHEKTVAYRVRQAEGLLGRRVRDRRIELEAALLLHPAVGV